MSCDGTDPQAGGRASQVPDRRDRRRSLRGASSTPAPRDRRASVALKLLAGLDRLRVLTPDSFPNSAGADLPAFNARAGLVVALSSSSCSRPRPERPWAIAALRPCSSSLIAVAGVVLRRPSPGGSQGVLRIPFELVLAAWVLLGEPSHIPDAAARSARSLRDHRRREPLLGAMVAFGYALPAGAACSTSNVVDLVASLPGRLHEPPAPARRPSIAVSFDWSWSTDHPAAERGRTRSFVGWTGDDAEGRPLYLLGATAADPTRRHQIRPARRLGKRRSMEARAGSRVRVP